MSQPCFIFLGSESEFKRSACAALARMGHELLTMDSLHASSTAATAADVDIVIVDCESCHADVEALKSAITQNVPDVEFILIGAIDQSGMSAPGCYSLPQPVEIATLCLLVTIATEHRRLIRQQRLLHQKFESHSALLQTQIASARRCLQRCLSRNDALVGNSAHANAARQFVACVAPDDCCAMIRGETGTGKQALARLIHEFSDRVATGDFHKINCRASSEAILEAELFGHEEGALTGADRKKPGRLELADGGTVYFEEVADLSLHLQSRLLQFIQNGQFLRVGGTHPIPVDVRVIASSTGALENMVSAGSFRADLYYTLSEHCLALPALRERSEDIPLLAQHYLDKHAEKLNQPIYRLSSGEVNALLAQSWPGNLPELEEAMRRHAVGISSQGLLLSQPAAKQKQTSISAAPEAAAAQTPGNTLAEMEVQTLLHALFSARWNQRQAAKNLGLSYSALRRRIAKHGLKHVKNEAQIESAAPAKLQTVFDGHARSYRA